MIKRFKRVIDFYGRDGFDRIRGAGVLVAGLGGVGSHTASALARSGIGRLVLVDFDRVTESSLNRNSVAGSSHLGLFKAEAVAETLFLLCPDTEYVSHNVFINRENLDSDDFLRNQSIVVDAIDSLNPKTQLLQFCVENKINVYSSMGASGRRDPSLVKTGDISETTGCPLARFVRKYLKRRGITKGIHCVWSTEQARKPLPPDEDEPRYDTRGRTRNSLPSLIAMPGIFGYALAQMVLDHIATGSSS